MWYCATQFNQLCSLLHNGLGVYKPIDWLILQLSPGPICFFKVKQLQRVSELRNWCALVPISLRLHKCKHKRGDEMHRFGLVSLTKMHQWQNQLSTSTDVINTARKRTVGGSPSRYLHSRKRACILIAVYLRPGWTLVGPRRNMKYPRVSARAQWLTSDHSK